MNKSSYKLFAVFLTILILFVAEIIYYSLNSRNNYKIEQKQKAVSLIQLPDLALANETIWIRHRSISNVFSIFPEDGTLLDYYPSSFVYNVQPIPIQRGQIKK
jgi:hypothetical protein